MSAKVAGECPMGCGPTLFLGSGGYVTCSLDICPRPDAAVDILADGDPHHVVVLGEAGFTVRHPLRERLDDALLTCSLHEWLVALPGPPRQRGRYRVLAPVLAVGGLNAWDRAMWLPIEAAEG